MPLSTADVLDALRKAPEFGQIVSNQIADAGVVTQLATRVNAAGLQYRATDIADLEAHFVDYGEEKPSQDLSLRSVEFTVRPLVIITAFEKYVSEDVEGFSARLTQKISEAFAKALDREMLLNSDGKFAAGVVQAARTAGNSQTLAESASIYDALNTALGQVEGKGYDPSAIVYRISEGAKLRAEKDSAGRPLFLPTAGEGSPEQILGLPAYKTSVLPTTSAPSETRFVVGAWGNLRYAIYEDVGMEIFTSGVVRIGNTDYNLIMQNLVAVRAEMRVGFGISDGGAFAVIDEPAA